MSGLLRRLTRRRAATADETRPTTPEASEPDAAPAKTSPEPEGGHPVAAAPTEGEQPTQLIPQTGERAATPGSERPTTVVPAVPGGESATTGDEGATTAAVPETTGDQAAPGDKPETAGADTTAVEPPATPGDEKSAAVVPATPGEVVATVPPPARDLPAGVDAGELEAVPGSARRGRLRRRLRYLRRIRELLLRDLGGFTYELHRTGGGVMREAHRRLVETKTGRLAALDSEVRELEARLGDPHADPVIRVPGVGGTCPECGELHSSDARYCFHCGAPLDAKARAEREAAIRTAAQSITAAQPTPEPQAASVLWAAGPRPQAAAEPADKPEDHTATSQWLTGAATPAPRDDAAAAQVGDEPSTAGDDSAAGEPSAAGGETAAAGDEASAAGDESTAAGDEATAARDETTTAGDESTASGDEATASGDEESGEATAAGDEESGEATAGGDAEGGEATAAGDEEGEATAGGDEATAAGDPKADEGSGPNGRRDDDVPPPARPGDPLGTRGEQPS